MRDRFGLIQRLDYFGEEDLVRILERAAKLWDMKYSEESLPEVAKRSRGTARVALRLLRRIRDYTHGSKEAGVTMDSVSSALELLGVDSMGLEEIDREILSIIYKHFNGGPVGLSTLAASVSEDIGTLAEVYEPFLMKSGLIKRTARGRVLTESGLKKAMEILGITSMM
jgi:Holliday junction DNA helicase RuvB